MAKSITKDYLAPLVKWAAPRAKDVTVKAIKWTAPKVKAIGKAGVARGKAAIQKIKEKRVSKKRREKNNKRITMTLFKE